MIVPNFGSEELADQQRYHFLKEKEILISTKKIVVPPFDPEKVVVVDICGDAKKYPDMYGHFRQEFGVEEVFICAGPGRPLFLAPHPDLEKYWPHKHEVVVREVFYALKAFKTNQLALIFHANCAVASEIEIAFNLFQIVGQAVKAKAFLQNANLDNPIYAPHFRELRVLKDLGIQTFNVVLLLHFAVLNGKRTYETRVIDDVMWLDSGGSLESQFSLVAAQTV